MDGNRTVEQRLQDLEQRVTAQTLSLYAVIWTISRIEPEAADRIRGSLDRLTGHLKPEIHGAALVDEMQKLQLALVKALDLPRQGQG